MSLIMRLWPLAVDNGWAFLPVRHSIFEAMINAYNCKNHELSLIRPGPCSPTEVWGWALRRGPLRLGPGGVARVGLPNHSHCRSFQLYSVVEQCWHDMHDSMWLRPGMGRTRARRTGRGGACHTIQVGVRTCLP